MDHTSPAEIAQVVTICLAVIAAGFYEYRRRAETHRLRMALFSRGILPPDDSRGRPSSNLVSIGLVCVFYALALGVLLALSGKTGPGYARSIQILAAVLSPPFVILLLIFIRDFRRSRRTRREAV